MTSRPLGFLSVALLLAACGPSPATPIPDAGGADGEGDGGPVAPAEVGPPERPARLTVPSEYDAATPSPLVLVLHGYGANGAAQSVYFGLPRLLRREAFYVLAPDGTLDEAGLRHWDVRGETVDDHAYLRGLIEDTRAAVPVSEVFVLGHSNGGFMAYRLACDSADLVDGIVSLAGSEALERCAPERPVSVLQIHGTADDTVLFDGGEIRGYAYASASQVVATWAARLGCDPSIERLPAIDLVGEVEGAETRVESYRGACRDGTAAELWAMEGAGHIPGLTAGFASDVLAWLRAR